MNNFGEQFRYGHREVLVLYSGVSPFLAIRGSIEHGWSPFGPSVGVPKWGKGRYLNLAWSSSAMEGMNLPKSVVPIGAPFLYLLELIGSRQDPGFEPNKRQYLYYPPHGSEEASPLIEKQLNSIEQLVNPNEVTVQLYWTEYLNKKVRQSYEERGFTVDTAGFCGMSSTEGLGVSSRQRAMSDIGGRHLFLLNVLLNLFSHKHVFAGHFSTSTLYAGFLNKPITLLGDWYSHDTTHEFDKNPEVARAIAFHDYYRHLIEEVVPKHFINGQATGSFYGYCKRELGWENLKSKEELATLLYSNSLEISNKFTVIDLEREIKKVFGNT
jgi:hypothetical protein